MAENPVSYLHQLASQRGLNWPEFSQVSLHTCFKNYKLYFPIITVYQNCHHKSGFFANVLFQNGNRGNEMKHWQKIPVRTTNRHGNGDNFRQKNPNISSEYFEGVKYVHRINDWIDGSLLNHLKSVKLQKKKKIAR